MPRLPRFRTLSAIALLLLFTSVCVAVDPLPGRWVVKATPEDMMSGAREFETALVFEDGTFTAEALKEHGFGPGEYEERPSPAGGASFEAKLKSGSGATAVWTGMVAASGIRGQLVWTKPDGTEEIYSFAGKRE